MYVWRRSTSGFRILGKRYLGQFSFLFALNQDEKTWYIIKKHYIIIYWTLYPFFYCCSHFPSLHRWAFPVNRWTTNVSCWFEAKFCIFQVELTTAPGNSATIRDILSQTKKRCHKLDEGIHNLFHNFRRCTSRISCKKVISHLVVTTSTCKFCHIWFQFVHEIYRNGKLMIRDVWFDILIVHQQEPFHKVQFTSPWSCYLWNGPQIAIGTAAAGRGVLYEEIGEGVPCRTVWFILHHRFNPLAPNDCFALQKGQAALFCGIAYLFINKESKNTGPSYLPLCFSASSSNSL